MQLLRGRTTGITTLAISPDSRFVVASGGKVAGSMMVCDAWDLLDPSPTARTLHDFGSWLFRATFTTRTTFLAYSGDMWGDYDLVASNCIMVNGPVPDSTLCGAILHPVGGLLKSLSFNVIDAHGVAEVKLATSRLITGGFELVKPVIGDTNLARLLSYNPSGGRYLAEYYRLVEGNSGYHLRDAATDHVVVTFQDSRGMRASMPHDWSFTPDGRRLFAFDWQNIAAYDCDAGGPPILEFPIALDSQFDALAVHPDGRVVATVEDQRTVTLRDADTLQPLRSYDFAMPRLTCVAFTPDGTRCVVGNSRGKVLLFDVE